ncbi:hypothetical protein E7T09_04265 [Deinococcus sp. KSM4-11]|uniref:hypothetical protein n=1 Tax=Deinococcus sp. KSM4-11 TaxID=2568654 RepID=UPI0010A45BDE|nr:hypothetical protein [Deinococcus sp. KSM4-11]THF88428.1 hypothetical protein E7T09_04265 [Deinococcus sp. KSM4-11]
MVHHQPAPHPQLAVTLQAAQQPITPGEPSWSGVSGGMTVTMTRSQWGWLAAEKARRHGRAYRVSKKAQQVVEAPYGGPRNPKDQMAVYVAGGHL